MNRAMRVLPWNFTILRFCGLWQPRDWSNGWKKYIYAIHTCFTIFLTYTFTITEMIEFVRTLDDIDEAAGNCLLTLTTLNVCTKIANFIYKRDEVIKLVDMLESEICRPRGDEEIAIQMRFDKRGRINTMLLCGLSEGAVIAITLGSFMENVSQRTLPFNAWLPFDRTTDLGFWVAYIHQALAHAMSATVGSIHDTLFYGFMAQSCSQLNILKSRLRSMPGTIGINQKSGTTTLEAAEKIELGKCVRHHQEILRFVELSNDIFNIPIFMQFSVSTFVICVSTYTLSKTSLFSAEFTFVIVYLACMIVQIFLMCWNGNEVIVESMDVGTAVYEMDWTSLRQSLKKDLRMIMTRTSDPIRYTSGHVITLSLDSYNSLIKFSYSIYNLLQQTSS